MKNSKRTSSARLEVKGIVSTRVLRNFLGKYTPKPPDPFDFFSIKKFYGSRRDKYRCWLQVTYINNSWVTFNPQPRKKDELLQQISTTEYFSRKTPKLEIYQDLGQTRNYDSGKLKNRYRILWGWPKTVNFNLESAGQKGTYQIELRFEFKEKDDWNVQGILVGTTPARIELDSLRV